MSVCMHGTQPAVNARPFWHVGVPDDRRAPGYAAVDEQSRGRSSDAVEADVHLQNAFTQAAPRLPQAPKLTVSSAL